MDLLLVRHGSRHQDGMTDSGLTVHGHHQIQALGRALRPGRARSTATSAAVRDTPRKRRRFCREPWERASRLSTS